MERLGYEFQDKDQQIVRKKEERAQSPYQVWNYLNQSDQLSLTGRSLSVKPYLGSGYSILSEPLMINKLIETLTSLIGNSLSEEGDDRLIRGSEDLILLVIDLCQKILEETKGDRDEDLIFKLYLDSDIYHTYIQKKLTLAEVGSSSGRPQPACLPDPTKKRRISQTIDQELKLPKNKSSSSGLDDQQTENATEETTLIPQIKKGVHKVLITSTPYTTYCALLLYIYSKLSGNSKRKKEREKDQRINEELEQRNQS
ncbi:hypothetical protein PPACK8108_LOCUS25479 [Phakopsora pachyrhizi]|uniref:Uncharacterized protein n=1 Tax=Phakopsora pachyrhizi TaxID=170000 RepID=A0AAV0BV62_PHAPC|nr:hypothetical protein PPACK8108_LOCUS25479 [Phakopsora pachyrhizi]